MALSQRLAVCLLIGTPIAPAVLAQELFVYPAKGQNQAQQDRDRYECHSWAAQQTGFDPTRGSMAAAPAPSAAPAPEPPQGGLLRGAARGAAIGAVGGAIAGNAGKGAAIGAGTGALIGGFRRRDQLQREAAQQSTYQQQQGGVESQQRSRRDAYNRAMSACLQGRGYSVN